MPGPLEGMISDVTGTAGPGQGKPVMPGGGGAMLSDRNFQLAQAREACQRGNLAACAQADRLQSQQPGGGNVTGGHGGMGSSSTSGPAWVKPRKRVHRSGYDPNKPFTYA